MRSRLITIAAWTAAIAVVTWQRLLRPAVAAAFPAPRTTLNESSESHPYQVDPAPRSAPPSVVRVQRAAPPAAQPKRRTAKAKPAAIA